MGNTQAPDEHDNDEALNNVLQNSADMERRRIYLFGEISESTAYRFTVAFQKMDETPGPITVVMNTVGGNIGDGFGIYDAIRFAQNEVLMVGFGEIASMGAVILQAGDKRIIAPHCVFMIHDASIEEPDTMNMSQLRTLTKVMEKHNERILNVLAESSGVPLTKIQDWCKAETTFSAEDAVKEGFADEVLVSKKPQRGK